MKIKKFNILSIDFDWIQNLRQQEELLNYLIPLIYSHDKIILSYTHDKIFPFFKHGYDEYNLFNIDHHHDIFYAERQKLDEGNWLHHLSNIYKNKINYVWISNPDSKHILPSELKNLKSFRFDHNINYIKQEKFDMIFICCSPDCATTPEVITSYKIIENLVYKKYNDKHY